MNIMFEKIKQLLDEGKSRSEIAIILDCQKSVVNYYANPNNWWKFERRKNTQIKRLNFEESILSVVNYAHSLSEICDLIGILHTRTNIDRVSKFLEERGIYPKWQQKQINKKLNGYWTKNTIFTENSDYQTSKLKGKLIQFGIKEEKCEICGNTEWQGKPIPLQTHHINGNHKDHRIENLQLLCPNCHAQTDNWCKNARQSKNNTHASKEKDKKIKYSEIISKELLKQKLYSPDFKSISSLANDLNLNRKTLQKICKYYKLPSTSKELGKFIKIPEITCKYCGKLFKPARKDAKYCSKECFRLDNNQPINSQPTKTEILEQAKNFNSMKTLAKYFGYKDLRSSCRKVGLPLNIKALQQFNDK